jgi:hypothetical protein
MSPVRDTFRPSAAVYVRASMARRGVGAWRSVGGASDALTSRPDDDASQCRAWTRRAPVLPGREARRRRLLSPCSSATSPCVSIWTVGYCRGPEGPSRMEAPSAPWPAGGPLRVPRLFGSDAWAPRAHPLYRPLGSQNCTQMNAATKATMITNACVMLSAPSDAGTRRGCVPCGSPRGLLALGARDADSLKCAATVYGQETRGTCGQLRDVTWHGRSAMRPASWA